MELPCQYQEMVEVRSQIFDDLKRIACLIPASPENTPELLREVIITLFCQVVEICNLADAMLNNSRVPATFGAMLLTDLVLKPQLEFHPENFYAI